MSLLLTKPFHGTVAGDGTGNTAFIAFQKINTTFDAIKVDVDLNTTHAADSDIHLASSTFLKHSLATAANDWLVASGAGAFVKKTLAQAAAIMLASGAFATDAQGTLADSAIQQAGLDAAVAGLYDHKGAYNASTNSPDLDTSPSGIKKADAYTVSAAGTFYAVTMEAGDVLIADQDNPTQSSHWTIVNRNIDSTAFATAGHTIVSHDTTATGAELNTLTDNSIADVLHRHSELVASDGSPDPALSVDATGHVTVIQQLNVVGWGSFAIERTTGSVSQNSRWEFLQSNTLLEGGNINNSMFLAIAGGESGSFTVYPDDADKTKHFRVEADGGAIVTGALSCGALTSTGIALNQTTSTITTDTSDASDNKRLLISGGGVVGDNRGGYISLYGNEFGAGGEGDVRVIAGDIASSGRVLLQTSGTPRVTVEYDGDVTVSTGNLVIATTAKGLISAQADLNIEATLGGVNIITHTDAGDDFAVNTSMFVVEGDTGYVGVGTASPAGKLDIWNGRFYLSDIDVAHGVTGQLPTNAYFGIRALSSTTGGTIFTSIAEGDNALRIQAYSGSTNPSDGLPIMGFRAGKSDGGTGTTSLSAAETAYQFSDHDGGTDWLTILGSGSVQIGTPPIAASTSADNLVISDLNNVGIALLTQNNKNAHLMFGDEDDADVGLIAYDHSIDSMLFYVDTAIALTIDAAQNSTFAGGILVGNPTGGLKGVGTINAVAVYDDNVLLTGADYVFDMFFDGAVKENERTSAAMLLAQPELLNVDEYGHFWEEYRHLPSMPSREEWIKNGKASLGQLANSLWEATEMQAIHIDQLNQRIKQLEQAA